MWLGSCTSSFHAYALMSFLKRAKKGMGKIKRALELLSQSSEL